MQYTARLVYIYSDSAAHLEIYIDQVSKEDVHVKTSLYQ